MNPRRKQSAVTRAALLDAAAATFPVHGYRATTTALLASTAELTAGALFHHFPDKTAIATAWITERLGSAIQDEWILPLETIRSPEDLRHLCQRRLAVHSPTSPITILTTLNAEVASREPAPAAALAGILNSWHAALAAAFQRARQSSLAHPSIQPDAEAAFLVSLISGMTVAATTPDLRRGALRAMDAYFETLRNPSA